MGYGSDYYDFDETNYNVFLLSKAEAENTDYFANDEARQCLATAYAKKNGAWVWDQNGCGYWWLRSPYPNYSNDVYSVNYAGVIGDYFDVNDDDFLARPALWINL